MKVERYSIHQFDKEVKDVNIIHVPQGSLFLRVKVLQDGIYAFYAIPEMILTEAATQEEKFGIVRPKQSIPPGQFIDILDIVIDMEEGQGIMIFPIYKL